MSSGSPGPSSSAPSSSVSSATLDFMEIDEGNTTPIIPSNGDADHANDSSNDDSGNDDSGNDDSGNDDSGNEVGVKRWLINPEPKGPRKISAKRRADTAAFERWIAQNHETLSKRAKKPIVGDDQSAVALVQNYENKKIIENPRDYQVELFERAKTQNTIAVLDTGSGKTLIAALLLRWTLENEVEDRAKGNPKRIAFFLVDKVALVFQQHAVLTCNLNFPIERLCGEIMEGVQDLKGFWANKFDKNMAIVCTADVLQSCLSSSWIRMEQINLIVFDEAHHTKKNHPYARIIKDFYIEGRKTQQRPRILGMTASPVDADIAPERAAMELEGLLDSHIATVADLVLMQNSICKPKNEHIVEYDAPEKGPTILTRSLEVLLGNNTFFRKPFAFACCATSVMGPWCVDRFWQFFFQKHGLEMLEAKTLRAMREIQDVNVDEYIAKLRQAYQIVETHSLSRPALDTEYVSPKVLTLIKVLQKQFKNAGDGKKCIVFVEQRYTARGLLDLLQQPEMQIPGLRPGVLTGNGNTGDEGTSVSFREQVVTLMEFRRGEINCLFATSIAEEGLDIPDCNIVIRFDLYNTLIQYIQSRGRARQDGSMYFHMVQKHNQEQMERVVQIKEQGDALRKFCEALPEDRLLMGHSCPMESFLHREGSQRQYTVKETGAKVNYQRSLVCLSTFVSSLPHAHEKVDVPQFYTYPCDGGYRCEVTLPSASPVRKAIGMTQPSKQNAKCSAAFEACLELIKGGHLDEHLRPKFAKQLPLMRNARLGISGRKSKEYKMRVKPEVWSTLGEPLILYGMALTLETPDALGRPSKPLVLLTRSPLPAVASFPLFFGSSRSSKAHCISVPGSLEVGDADLAGLTAFTLAIFRDVFSKKYEATAAQLPYFVAPASTIHGIDFASANLNEILDWSTIGFVQQSESIEYSGNEPDDFFCNKLISDEYDGARKFFVRGRRTDMKPRDLVPEGVVSPRHRVWTKSGVSRDIYNYSVSLWAKAHAKLKFDENQPVVEAELLPIRRNLLDDDIGDEDLEPKQCFLILQPMTISRLPVDVVAMAYNFPAIIHRIEQNLIALDAFRLMGLDDVRPDLALEAFTKDSDNSDEHDVEKINFQAGMGNNYERLEFLGDCFLKMATTISLFTLIPDKGEFDYHVDRMLLVCNQNLLNNALEVKLEEFVRSMAFSRRSWYPEGLTLTRGKRATAKTQHTLADKSIADVCEAMIGAAYLTGKGTPNPFDMAVRAVTAVVKDPNHTMTSYAEYFAQYKPPSWQTATPTVVQKDMADRFYEQMGYRFTHPQILRSAFQHPTYPTSYEGLPSYQRLEFLGDALLDMVCIDHLFHRFPSADPQWLTEHKMAMISNQFLGCLGFYLGFHRSIHASSSQVLQGLHQYVLEMELALQQAKEAAVAAGGQESDFRRNFWIECSQPPKCLPDVVEAYIGAIFVDSSYDFSSVQRFFDDHLYSWFKDMRQYDTFANKHPVTLVGFLMQSKFKCLDWRLLVKEAGIVAEGDVGSAADLIAGRGRMQQVVCGVWVHGKMLAHAMATSSRYAKLAAAREAARILEGMSKEEFKGGFACGCLVEEGSQDDEEEEHATAI
ncbi:hypothetical protein OQA88_12764 [Cercophora sp. LCS_1]